MISTNLFNWIPALIARPNESLITIQVGERRETYQAHKGVLIDRSAFFAHALDNLAFSEAESNVVTLPEVNPKIFSIWLDWAYRCKLPCVALDIRLDETQRELAGQDCSDLESAESATACWLMIANTPNTVLTEICTEFARKCQALLEDDNDPESLNAEKAVLLSQIRDIYQLTKKVAPRNAIQAMDGLLEHGLRTGVMPKEQFDELKSSLRAICKTRVRALQVDPTLARDFRKQFRLEVDVAERKRPAFLNLIRLYHLADFLLSEECKNMVIDAVAEISSSSPYVPNAVDVAELWGFDNEVGSVEELRAPERNRNLKQLVRWIYRSKQTARLLLEEEDTYPELFLREIAALSHGSDEASERRTWRRPHQRCKDYHTHRETPVCNFPGMAGTDAS